MNLKNRKPKIWQAQWWREDRERGRWAATFGVIAVLLVLTAYATPGLSGHLLPEWISAEDAEELRLASRQESEQAAQDAQSSVLPENQNAQDMAAQGTQDTQAQGGAAQDTQQAEEQQGPTPEALAVLAGGEEIAPEDGMAAAFVPVAPLAGSLRLQRGYGYDYNPNTEDYRFHRGCDIAAALDDAVLAVAAGTVSEAYADDYWGGVVVLVHEGGWSTLYKCLEPAVAAGEEVAQGALLGHILHAPAEAVQDPHLHLELEFAGESRDPLDLVSALLPE